MDQIDLAVRMVDHRPISSIRYLSHAKEGSCESEQLTSPLFGVYCIEGKILILGASVTFILFFDPTSASYTSFP